MGGKGKENKNKIKKGYILMVAGGEGYGRREKEWVGEGRWRRKKEERGERKK